MPLRKAAMGSRCSWRSSTPARTRGRVGVVRNRIPGAEDQVLERGQRDEVADQRGAFVGALAQPDGTHLRDRSDRPSRPAADVLHTGDERRGYRTQPHTQHPELPLSRRDLPGGSFPPLLRSFRERIE